MNIRELRIFYRYDPKTGRLYNLLKRTEVKSPTILHKGKRYRSAHLCVALYEGRILPEKTRIKFANKDPMDWTLSNLEVHYPVKEPEKVPAKPYPDNPYSRVEKISTEPQQMRVRKGHFLTITPANVHDLFHYDQDTGDLQWRSHELTATKRIGHVFERRYISQLELPALDTWRIRWLMMYGIEAQYQMALRNPKYPVTKFNLIEHRPPSSWLLPDNDIIYDDERHCYDVMVDYPGDQDHSFGTARTYEEALNIWADGIDRTALYQQRYPSRLQKPLSLERALAPLPRMMAVQLVDPLPKQIPLRKRMVAVGAGISERKLKSGEIRYSVKFRGHHLGVYDSYAVALGVRMTAERDWEDSH